MSKHEGRGHRPDKMAAEPGSGITGSRARPAESRGDSGAVNDRLARLLDSPHLARIVPHLPAGTLHQLIRSRGLDACGELVASATPAQLTAVFDLDLWHSAQPGRDDQFDDERFGQWLELLVDTGDAIAARILAATDENIVIAGLSRYVRVFDVAAFAPASSSDDESIADDLGRSGGLQRELGGYLVQAKKSDAWDAIMTLLLALDADHPDYFDAVMRGCRRLSNSAREIDGLDDLLTESEQLLHDVALEREQRRSQQGYATPADARAYLEMARKPRGQQPAVLPSTNPLAAAYFRATSEEMAAAYPRAQPAGSALPPPPNADVHDSIDGAIELLAEAGLVPERSQALALLDGTGPQRSRFARIRSLMEHVRDTDEAVYLTRSRELAFLANTLLAGCSIQSRPFTAREASDGAVAICNLGLEHWPTRWPEARTNNVSPTMHVGTSMPDIFLAGHDLLTAFEVGWAVLYQDVSMFVAEQLIATLMDLRSIDVDIERGLRALRRELERQRDAGTPWRARNALDVIATLDTPAWVGLLGLLDECPILPAALTATVEGHTRAVSPTAFEFISTTEQIGKVRRFMGKLVDVLLG